MINILDYSFDNEVKVSLQEEGEQYHLRFSHNDYDDVLIIMPKDVAKSLHNVTRRLYPSYSVENVNKSKVCIVLDSEKTPTKDMQLFLKGLKLNEVIA